MIRRHIDPWALPWWLIFFAVLAGGMIGCEMLVLLNGIK